MKIVHLIGYFQPEFGYKEFYLARNQAKLGHDVHVITSDRIFPSLQTFDLRKATSMSSSRFRPLGTSIIDRVTVHWLPTLLEFRGALLMKGIRRTLKEIQPDLVHAYEPARIAPILGAKYKSIGYKLFVDYQQFELPRSFLGKAFFFIVVRGAAQYLFRFADRILLCTEETKSFVHRYFRVDPKKIVSIPLGYDEDFFYFDQEERKKVRHDFGVSDSEILIITSGKITRDKSIELILYALAKLPKSLRWRFVILGGGDQKYLDELRHIGERLSLNQRLLWKNFVPKETLFRYYSAADLGIWPEQPSITILEAIGCSLPVLLPNRQTISHLIDHGNGATFLRGSSENLAQTLTGILREPQRLVVMRENTRTKAAPRFTYRHIAQQVIDLAQ